MSVKSSIVCVCHGILCVATLVLAVSAIIHLRVANIKQNTSASPSGNYFSPRQVEPVIMHYSATAHYQLDADDSDAEFARLLPSGGHLVAIDDEHGIPRNFTVTLFHQMKCLDILRREYVRSRSSATSETPLAREQPSALTQHCFNYLRQTILCRLNLGIESTRNAKVNAARDFEMMCPDWTEVYREAERNQATYIRERESHM